MSFVEQEKTGGASGANETMKGKVTALLVQAAAVAKELKQALKGANKKKLAKTIWSVAELKKVKTAIKNASGLKGAPKYKKSKSKSSKKNAAKAKKPGGKKDSYKQKFAAMFAKKPAAKKPAAKKQSYKQGLAAMFAKKPKRINFDSEGNIIGRKVRTNKEINEQAEKRNPIPIKQKTLAELTKPIPSLLAPKPRSPAKTSKRFVFDKEGNVVKATPVSTKKAKTPPVAKARSPVAKNKRVKFDSEGNVIGAAKKAKSPISPLTDMVGPNKSGTYYKKGSWQAEMFLATKAQREEAENLIEKQKYDEIKRIYAAEPTIPTPRAPSPPKKGKTPLPVPAAAAKRKPGERCKFGVITSGPNKGECRKTKKKAGRQSR